MEEARTPGGASPAATVVANAVLEKALDTPVEAPAATAAEGVARGESSAETGSQPGSGSGRDGGLYAGNSAALAGSEPMLDHEPVGRDAPNIPNVVEYHLKVKPQQVRRDQLADTNTAAVSIYIYMCIHVS